MGLHPTVTGLGLERIHVRRRLEKTVLPGISDANVAVSPSRVFGSNAEVTSARMDVLEFGET